MTNLSAKNYQLEERNHCPTCDGVNFKHILTIQDWSIYKCTNCTVLFNNPVVKNPNDLYQNEAYYEDRTISFRKAQVFARQNFPIIGLINRFLLANQSPGKQPVEFLEIGPGNGGLSLAAKNTGWNVTCADVSEVVKQKLKALDLTVELYDGNVLSFDLSSFDIVAMNHVIEHLKYPRETMESVARSLKPGGILYLVTPNHKSLDRYYHALKWSGWDIPYHLIHFNPKSLSTLLETVGLEVIYVDFTLFNPLSHIKRGLQAGDLRADIRTPVKAVQPAQTSRDKSPTQVTNNNEVNGKSTFTPYWKRKIKYYLSERNMIFIARKRS